MTDDATVGRRRPKPLDAEARALALLTDALAPIPPSVAARDKLMSALRGSERWTLWTSPVASLLSLPESAVLAALRAIEQPAAWRPGRASGSSLLRTPALTTVRAVIVRLAPGFTIPYHRHKQRERTFVLDGQVIENGTRTYNTGDLVDMAPGTEHTTTVPDTTSCLVVFWSSDT
ncbi:MAG: hypothetical protein RL701_4133 [Pseudomonadota bacterium]|jgi:anti-sigma factor ChrR (cupin superfamily)